MPEWGMIPMPKALLKQTPGYDTFIRCQMSGTSYGACILRSPEAFIGGLALIKTGDVIEIDILTENLMLMSRKVRWINVESSGLSLPHVLSVATVTCIQNT